MREVIIEVINELVTAERKTGASYKDEIRDLTILLENIDKRGGR